MAEGRRGRISQATYLRVVGAMLTRDWFALDQCDILTQLDLVEQLVTQYPTRYLCKGLAVRAILDKAIQQVIDACRASADPASVRVATYLDLRKQGQTTAAIARSWGMTREYVSRSVGRRAIHLVTDRTLRLGRRQLVAHDASEATRRPA